MNWERIFVRIQAACLLVLFLSAATWGPSRMLQFLARAGPPGPGELVPRQIPYRGYLEQAGVPAQGSQQMTFRIEFGDGGLAWTDTVSVPTANGHFDVALGDATGNRIPPAVFADANVNLTVAVGGQALAGAQRLLTVPYAASAANAWQAQDSLRAVNATNAGNALNSINANRALVADKLVISANGKSTSVGGLFCGATPSNFPGAVVDGSLTGYRATKSICETQCGRVTAHLCSAQEAVNSHILNFDVPVGVVTNPAESVDLRGGTNFFRDCNGFQSSSSTLRGLVWGGSSTSPLVGGFPCDAAYPLLCCD